MEEVKSGKETYTVETYDPKTDVYYIGGVEYTEEFLQILNEIEANLCRF